MLPELVVALALAAGTSEAEGQPCPPAIEAVVSGLAPGRWVGVILLDATDDEVPEVFIADTNRGGNAGEPWRVYRRAEDGRYVVLGSVFFHSRGFKVQGRTLKTYWRSNATSGRFISYRVSDTSIEEVESTDLLYWNDAEYERRWEEIWAWRDSIRDKRFGAKHLSATSTEQATVVCRPAL